MPFPLAPWLNQPDYFGSMTRGATLALDAQKMAQEGKLAAAQLAADQAKAAGSLGLGYANVAAGQQEAAAKLELARANELAQQAHQGVLEQNAAKGLELQAQGLGLQERSQDRLEQTAAANALKPQSPLGKLYSDLDIAIAAGDKPKIDSYKAAIEQAVTNKGKSIFMGLDDKGSPIFQFAEGGAKVIGNPTVATQTGAQQKLAKYQNSTELLNYLEKNMKPEHVGVKGVGGEMLVDRTLAQLVPGMANKERADIRATLTAAREGLMREISDDPRFSNKDREEIGKALPSNGAFESYENAMQRLGTVRRIVRSRAKTYSEQLGQPMPTWALEPDEIKARFQKGEIDEQAAIDALTRFH